MTEHKFLISTAELAAMVRYPGVLKTTVTRCAREKSQASLPKCRKYIPFPCFWMMEKMDLNESEQNYSYITHKAYDCKKLSSFIEDNA